MSYLESEALCPYYLRDANKVIQCELTTIKCKDKEMFKFIGYGYCANKYNQCMLKKAMDGFYERNGTEEPTCTEDAEQIVFF